jgi:integrase
MHHFGMTMRKAGLIVDKPPGVPLTPLFSFHSLRHTYASLLIANGVPIIEVSRLMGHAKVTTTLEVYGHLYEEDGKGRSAMEAISGDLTPEITSRSMRQRCDGNGQLLEYKRVS